MDKEWIALIGTLAGATIAGTAGYVLKYVEYNNLARREERKQILEKLEIIHEMLYSLPSKIFRFYTNTRILRLKSGEIKRPEDLLENFELKIEQDHNLREFVTRLSSLITVYAPEFSNDAKQLLELTQEFWLLIPDLKDEVIDNKKISEARDKLSAITIDLEHKISKKIRVDFFTVK